MRLKPLSWAFAALISLTGPVAQAAETEHPRWISAGGALTEWIASLGGAENLVAVDTTSTHVAGVQQLPNVGYQRQLAAEGVLALAPDLLIGSEEMGPPPMLEQLQRAGVKVERLSAAANVKTMDETVTRLGNLLNQPDAAEQQIAQFTQRLSNLQTQIKSAQQSQAAPRVLLVFGQGGGNPLVAGQDTIGDWLIKQAGGNNIAAHNNFRALSTEAMAGMDPEVLIVADRSLRDEAALQGLLEKNPGLSASSAVRHQRLISLDPTLLVGGLGPRIPAQLEQLMAAFYPASLTSIETAP